MAGTLLMAVLLVAVAPASAKDYTVGDSSGWTPGVDYSAWTQGKTFHVGDTLTFQYNAIHSVMEVSAADHGACSASNPLGSYKDQSTTIPLTKTGTRYFICGTSGHCAAGMKLAVTVVSGSSNSSSAPVTSTSAGRSTKPAGNGEPSSELDTASSAEDTTAAHGSSSKLTSNTSGAAGGSGVRLATVLLLVAMGLRGLMG